MSFGVSWFAEDNLQDASGCMQPTSKCTRTRKMCPLEYINIHPRQVSAGVSVAFSREPVVVLWDKRHLRYRDLLRLLANRNLKLCPNLTEFWLDVAHADAFFQARAKRATRHDAHHAAIWSQNFCSIACRRALAYDEAGALSLC
mmetsp:Transcript_36462/g.90751  ORF Transcript_36462/g.90751 Transcript_36462/m.90751 type:complete len:144 (-) Transcript_36462:586-1017(-)